MTLEYAGDRSGGGVVVVLRGDLAGERWTDRLREFLHEYYLDDGVRTLTIDLGSVEHVDLEGISTLLTLSAESLRHGKGFRVRGAAGEVRGRLEATGALRYLEAGGDPRS